MTEFGIGTYIRNVVRTLARLDRDSTYYLIGLPAKVAECGPLPASFHAVPLADRENTLKGNFEFRAIVRRLDCDVVHIPHLFWIPRGLPCPYVVTVHDLLEHMYGAREGSNLRRSLHLQLTRRALHKAARVLAVSQFTKSEIEQTFGIPGERIEVVYNAIDERFLRGHASQSDCDLIAERYQVNYPFILYAGAIRPHKNVVRTIEAFSALKTELEK
jgi:glycosyltransferase involved in cell wall biosynthesis